MTYLVDSDSSPDLFIAATVLQPRLTLVTPNRQHFERLPKLQLYDEAAPVPSGGR
jgi:predicted nucleic acid-binding protein